MKSLNFHDDYWGSNTSASTDDYSYKKLYRSAGTDWNYVKLGKAMTKWCKVYTDATNQIGNWMQNTIYIVGEMAKRWYSQPRTPDMFMFVPGEELEELGPTQRLAPIDEAIEIDVKNVKEHLEKLLNDEEYRNEQLTEINRINKELKLEQVTFNPEAVRKKLLEIKEAYSPVNMWKRKAEKWMQQKAEENATRLFNEVFTPEEIMKLETDKKLIISRKDLTFELLANGKINQLLPDGEKIGWCLVSKEDGLPLPDILVMKKLILENTPQLVIQTANKMSPFGG